MKIVFKASFVKRLENQIEFIALDSPERALKFYSELLTRLKEIPSNPYRYRKSIYFENRNIRDMIFKGYVIVFRITDNFIELIGFVKYRNKPI